MKKILYLTACLFCSCMAQAQTVKTQIVGNG